jgi:hypothetical protein
MGEGRQVAVDTMVGIVAVMEATREVMEVMEVLTEVVMVGMWVIMGAGMGQLITGEVTVAGAEVAGEEVGVGASRLLGS